MEETPGTEDAIAGFGVSAVPTNLSFWRVAQYDRAPSPRSVHIRSPRNRGLQVPKTRSPSLHAASRDWRRGLRDQGEWARSQVRSLCTSAARQTPRKRSPAPSLGPEQAPRARVVALAPNPLQTRRRATLAPRPPPRHWPARGLCPRHPTWPPGSSVIRLWRWRSSSQLHCRILAFRSVHLSLFPSCAWFITCGVYLDASSPSTPQPLEWGPKPGPGGEGDPPSRATSSGWEGKTCLPGCSRSGWQASSSSQGRPSGAADSPTLFTRKFDSRGPQTPLGETLGLAPNCCFLEGHVREAASPEEGNGESPSSLPVAEARAPRGKASAPQS